MKNTMLCIGFIILCAFFCTAEQFVVIDISGGKDANSYPVEKLDEMPSGGWTDEYKTDKIVLSKVNDFYIGVFEITQRQWELVTGKRPSYYKNDNCYAKRPVENVSYDDIRGKEKGSEYPKTSEVDGGSFIGNLRAKSGLDKLDLPTREQWEVACRDPNGGNAANDPNVIAKCARFGVNPGYYFEPPAASPNCGVDNGTAEVGSYAPNARGLYDMHGNVCEWCVDVCDVTDEHVIMLGCTWNEFRPFGEYRVLKGGHCESSAPYCVSTIIYGGVASFGGSVKGLRIVLNK